MDLEVPVVPVHGPLGREQVELVAQETEFAVLDAQRRELQFEPARMVAIVVVPLADNLAARGVDRRVAQSAERAARGLAMHGDHCTLLRCGQCRELRIERNVAVVDDDELALGPRLTDEIRNGPLQARVSRFTRYHQTTYHRATGGRWRPPGAASRSWAIRTGIRRYTETRGRA